MYIFVFLNLWLRIFFVRFPACPLHIMIHIHFSKSEQVYTYCAKDARWPSLNLFYHPTCSCMGLHYTPCSYSRNIQHRHTCMTTHKAHCPIFSQHVFYILGKLTKYPYSLFYMAALLILVPGCLFHAGYTQVMLLKGVLIAGQGMQRQDLL